MAATMSIVQATRPSQLLDAASAQDDKAAAVGAQIGVQQRSVTSLRANWRGGTADAAIAKAEADLARQRAVHRTLTNHAAAVRFGGTNLDPLRSQILAMASQARALGGMVSDDGTVVGNRATGVMTPVLAGAYTTSLKSMLTVFDRVDQTVADALRTGAPVVQTPPRPTFAWTDAHLYDGVPAGSDVNQDGIGDCYLVATMSAIANADPQWIKDRISFDPRTGFFDVTLWDGSAWRHITVTQADIDADIAAGGASGVDNTVAGAPLWPAVLESAYAKLTAPGRGVQGIDRGVTPAALKALTGNDGDWIFPAAEWFSTQHIDARIADALDNNQPVLLSTSLLTDDPVTPMHVYSVEAIAGTGSDATVTLRNPWGPGSSLPPVFDMRLSDLIGTNPLGGLGLGPTAMINIGRMGS